MHPQMVLNDALRTIVGEREVNVKRVLMSTGMLKTREMMFYVKLVIISKSCIKLIHDCA